MGTRNEQWGELGIGNYGKWAKNLWSHGRRWSGQAGEPGLLGVKWKDWIISIERERQRETETDTRSYLVADFWFGLWDTRPVWFLQDGFSWLRDHAVDATDLTVDGISQHHGFPCGPILPYCPAMMASRYGVLGSWNELVDTEKSVIRRAKLLILQDRSDAYGVELRSICIVQSTADKLYLSHE